MRSPNTVDHYGGNDFEKRYVLRRDENCLRVSAKTGVSREPPRIAGMRRLPGSAFQRAGAMW